MREALAANRLPDEEVLALVRSDLYEPFETPGDYGLPLRRLVRWSKATRPNVSHVAGCDTGAAVRAAKRKGMAIGGTAFGVAWHVTPARGLSGEQWLTLRGMNASLVLVQQRALTLGLTVSTKLCEPTRHRGECAECHAKDVGVSIALEITWGTHRMVREYVL